MAAPGRHEQGKITDEGIAKLRERIGKGFEARQPWRTEINRDTIWHIAHAIGDLNELYTDPDYASRSKWGRLVCPGIVISAYDTLRAVGSAGPVQGLPGVHTIWTGSHYEWERPLFEGDSIHSESYLKDVVETESKFGGGRAVYQTYEAIYHDQTDAYLGRRTDTWIRVEREKTAKTAKYGAEERLAKWNEGDIDRFRAEYRDRKRNHERFWDEVDEGAEIPRIIKGPHTGTAEVAFEAFFGFYLMGNEVAYRTLEKHPKLFIANEQGVPEPPERVHWDNRFAQTLLGLPGAYDLGLERMSWMYQSVSDWMGDEGFIKQLSVQYRAFNYLGDVTWAMGTVKRKFDEGGSFLVELDVWTENQLGERTTIGEAIVELPKSRH